MTQPPVESVTSADLNLRDYVKWHKAYDDPTSDLSWRLQRVQAYIKEVLASRDGAVRVVSACAGDGRDLLQVLSAREDSDRVSGVLLEIHPDIVKNARRFAADHGLTNIEIKVADASITTAYQGAVPADLVLMIGIFGNISDDDLKRTIATAPQFCRPGATLLWSRGKDRNDRNDLVRAWFVEAGFTELSYLERNEGKRPALGAMRYDGPHRELELDKQLFTFWR